MPDWPVVRKMAGLAAPVTAGYAAITLPNGRHVETDPDHYLLQPVQLALAIGVDGAGGSGHFCRGGRWRHIGARHRWDLRDPAGRRDDLEPNARRRLSRH